MHGFCLKYQSIKLSFNETNDCITGQSKLWVHASEPLAKGDHFYLNFRGSSINKVSVNNARCTFKYRNCLQKLGKMPLVNSDNMNHTQNLPSYSTDEIDLNYRSSLECSSCGELCIMLSDELEELSVEAPNSNPYGECLYIVIDYSILLSNGILGIVSSQSHNKQTSWNNLNCLYSKKSTRSLYDVDGVRCWLPCMDTMNHRSKFDISLLNVPINFDAICSGTKVSKIYNDIQRTHSYRFICQDPIPAGALGWCIARVEKYTMPLYQCYGKIWVMAAGSNKRKRSDDSNATTSPSGIDSIEEADVEVDVGVDIEESDEVDIEQLNLHPADGVRMVGRQTIYQPLVSHTTLGLDLAMRYIHKFLTKAYNYGTYTEIFVPDLAFDSISFAGFSLIHSKFLHSKLQIYMESASHLVQLTAYMYSWFICSLPVDSYSFEFLIHGAVHYLINVYVEYVFGKQAGKYRFLKMYDQIIYLEKTGKSFPLVTVFTESHEKQVPNYMEYVICKATVLFHIIENKVQLREALRLALKQIITSSPIEVVASYTGVHRMSGRNKTLTNMLVTNKVSSGVELVRDGASSFAPPTPQMFGNFPPPTPYMTSNFPPPTPYMTSNFPPPTPFVSSNFPPPTPYMTSNFPPPTPYMTSNFPPPTPYMTSNFPPPTPYMTSNFPPPTPHMTSNFPPPTPYMTSNFPPPTPYMASNFPPPSPFDATDTGTTVQYGNMTDGKWIQPIPIVPTSASKENNSTQSITKPTMSESALMLPPAPRTLLSAPSMPPPSATKSDAEGAMSAKAGDSSISYVNPNQFLRSVLSHCSSNTLGLNEDFIDKFMLDNESVLFLKCNYKLETKSADMKLRMVNLSCDSISSDNRNRCCNQNESLISKLYSTKEEIRFRVVEEQDEAVTEGSLLLTSRKTEVYTQAIQIRSKRGPQGKRKDKDLLELEKEEKEDPTKKLLTSTAPSAQTVVIKTVLLDPLYTRLLDVVLICPDAIIIEQINTGFANELENIAQIRALRMLLTNTSIHRAILFAPAGNSPNSESIHIRFKLQLKTYMDVILGNGVLLHDVYVRCEAAHCLSIWQNERSAANAVTAPDKANTMITGWEGLFGLISCLTSLYIDPLTGLPTACDLLDESRLHLCHALLIAISSVQAYNDCCSPLAVPQILLYFLENINLKEEFVDRNFEENADKDGMLVTESSRRAFGGKLDEGNKVCYDYCYHRAILLYSLSRVRIANPNEDKSAEQTIFDKIRDTALFELNKDISDAYTNYYVHKNAVITLSGGGIVAAAAITCIAQLEVHKILTSSYSVTNVEEYILDYPQYFMMEGLSVVKGIRILEIASSSLLVQSAALEGYIRILFARFIQSMKHYKQTRSSNNNNNSNSTQATASSNSNQNGPLANLFVAKAITLVCTILTAPVTKYSIAFKQSAASILLNTFLDREPFIVPAALSLGEYLNCQGWSDSQAFSLPEKRRPSTYYVTSLSIVQEYKKTMFKCKGRAMKLAIRALWSAICCNECISYEQSIRSTLISLWVFAYGSKIPKCLFKEELLSGSPITTTVDPMLASSSMIRQERLRYPLHGESIDRMQKHMRIGVTEQAPTGKSVATISTAGGITISGGGPLKLSLSMSNTARRQSEMHVPTMMEPPRAVPTSSASQMLSPTKKNVSLKLTLGRNN